MHGGKARSRRLRREDRTRPCCKSHLGRTRVGCDGHSSLGGNGNGPRVDSGPVNLPVGRTRRSAKTADRTKCTQVEHKLSPGESSVRSRARLIASWLLVSWSPGSFVRKKECAGRGADPPH